MSAVCFSVLTRRQVERIHATSMELTRHLHTGKQDRKSRGAP